jgi:hypothetical protein
LKYCVHTGDYGPQVRSHSAENHYSEPNRLIKWHMWLQTRDN